MRIASFLVALGVVALSASRLAAQTCVGAASFSSGPVRLGAALASGDGVKSYGVTLAAGSRDGQFGFVDVGRAEFSDLDAKGTVIDAGAGYAFNVNPTGTVQFCPQVDLSHQSGPNIDLGGSTMTTSANAVAFGGSLGGVVPTSATLDVVPYLSGAFILSQGTATFDGTSDTQSQQYGSIGIGAGFVVHKTLTLQPSMAIPVGLKGATPSFQIAVAFNFGSQKH